MQLTKKHSVLPWPKKKKKVFWKNSCTLERRCQGKRNTQKNGYKLEEPKSAVKKVGST